MGMDESGRPAGDQRGHAQDDRGQLVGGGAAPRVAVIAEIPAFLPARGMLIEQGFPFQPALSKMFIARLYLSRSPFKVTSLNGIIYYFSINQFIKN